MGRRKKRVSVPGEFKAWKVPAWASRAAALTVNMAVLMQVTYYCTDALGLAPGLVGMILLISKLFDGFTDLIAGFIIDKTHSKLGKARPYEFCITVVWILTVLMFSTPDFGTVGKLIWVFVIYTMINSIFATFLNASDSVYMSRAFTSQDAQTKILSFGSPIQMICSIMAGAMLPLLISTFGKQEGGWTLISLIFAIPYGILGLARFFFIKEVISTNEGSSSEHQSLKTLLGDIKQNKYIFIISMFTILGGLISSIGSAVTTYYFQYIYGDLNIAGLLGALGILTPFILVIMPLLLKKNSLAKLCMYGAVIGALGNVIKLVGGTNLATLIIGNLISMVPMMFSCMINILLIECMDFGEWKNGVRVEGGLASINGFAGKLGSGLAAVIVGFIMQIAGYNGSLDVQSQSANFAIIALYSVVPLILYVVQFFVMKKYDLDKKLPDIHKDLDERRAQA